MFDYWDTYKHNRDWFNDLGAWVPGFAPGVTKTFDFGIVSKPQAAGNWVVIETGIIYNNQFTADDETVNSLVDARVTINSIIPTVFEFGGL